jgi:molybdopterin-binding protein
MPRKDQGWITFQLPEEERATLEQFCSQSQRTKTDVLRGLVRTLSNAPQAPLQEPSGEKQEQKRSGNLEFKAMRVSARNVFKAVIQKVRLGSVNAEITLEIAPGVQAVSVITRDSAESLELSNGKAAYAVIKSSDVMVAVDD